MTTTPDSPVQPDEQPQRRPLYQDVADALDLPHEVLYHAYHQTPTGEVMADVMVALVGADGRRLERSELGLLFAPEQSRTVTNALYQLQVFGAVKPVKKPKQVVLWEVTALGLTWWRGEMLPMLWSRVERCPHVTADSLRPWCSQCSAGAARERAARREARLQARAST